MTFRSSRVFLASLLLTVSLPAWSATHEVQIGNNFYSPSDITIEVGDTVHWTYNGGMQHDVTADDFSWNSPTSSNIDFSKTFNTVEEVLYHCTVHSQPGRTIGTFQNGRINVVAPQADPIVINRAMSDAWYEPATNGQGFFIIAWEGIEVMFLSWFTFDSERPPEDATAIVGEPGHRWLTAIGSFAEDTAVLDVFLSTGGVFDSAEPPVTTDQTPVGSMTIVWHDCNSATLTYNLPDQNLSGEIPLERVVTDNVAECEQLQGME